MICECSTEMSSYSISVFLSLEVEYTWDTLQEVGKCYQVKNGVQ